MDLPWDVVQLDICQVLQIVLVRLEAGLQGGVGLVAGVVDGVELEMVTRGLEQLSLSLPPARPSRLTLLGLGVVGVDGAGGAELLAGQQVGLPVPHLTNQR